MPITKPAATSIHTIGIIQFLGRAIAEAILNRVTINSPVPNQIFAFL